MDCISIIKEFKIVISTLVHTMAIIPKHIVDSVVAIGIEVDNNMTWIGTGFLVARKEDHDKTKSTIYLITNKHVVQNQEKLWIRFNSNKTKVKDYSINLFDNGSQAYSTHSDADVIAIRINPGVLIDDESVFGFIDLDDASLSVAEMAKTEVSEGNIVYALGFPMNIVENNRKTPICRMGCISRIANVEDNLMNFIIDAQVFPGNSGGPVINRPEVLSITGTNCNSSANLIGIVCSYIPYKESLQSTQTKRIISIHEENSGLTNVCPVDYIREVVEKEHSRASRIN